MGNSSTSSSRQRHGSPSEGICAASSTRTRRNQATASAGDVDENPFHEAEAWLAKNEVADPSKKPTKYYAIAVGRKTGVFTTRDEHLQHTDGFKGSISKSFPTKNEADAWLARNEVADPSPSTIPVSPLSSATPKKPTKYYAIAVGRKTGVFTTQAEHLEHTRGFKGRIDKSFKTRNEAEAWFKGVSRSLAKKGVNIPPINTVPTKYYAIAVGRKTGVFTTRDEHFQHTDGFKGSMSKTFMTRNEAEAWLAKNGVTISRDEQVSAVPGHISSSTTAPSAGITATIPYGPPRPDDDNNSGRVWNV